jgi:hypothetical protein
VVILCQVTKSDHCTFYGVRGSGSHTLGTIGHLPVEPQRPPAVIVRVLAEAEARWRRFDRRSCTQFVDQISPLM